MAIAYNHTAQEPQSCTLAELFVLLGYHFGYGNYLVMPESSFCAFDAPAVQNQLFLKSFLTLTDDSTEADQRMQLSDRGTRMIGSLVNLPVPIARQYWAMPDDPLLVDPRQL